MDNKRFSELLNLYLLDNISDREGAELAEMLQLPAYQSEFERIVNEQLQNKEFNLENPPQSVHDRIQTHLYRETSKRSAPVNRVHFRRHTLWRYAAAAVLLFAVAGTYVYQRAKTPTLLAQEKRFKNDMPPGGRHATLILADGSRLSMTDSLLPLKTKETGEVDITTGSGETYSLTLSDGTKVWLNASSSLRCPVAFSVTQRRVQLDGEAYFEVRHDAKRPFTVQLPDGSLVKDLGTRFNIHAYSDEPAIRTTLLEGAVQVVARGQELSLAPGEQAEHSANKKLIRLEKVNLQNTVAWKEEQFHLEATSIDVIMKQVERWYGAEITYQDDMQKDTTQFFGSLPRNVPVSQLLRMLEATGHVHFIIEGNKITVMK